MSKERGMAIRMILQGARDLLEFSPEDVDEALEELDELLRDLAKHG